MTHPANKIENIRRRVNRARNFPTNTCGSSRHVHIMADCLAGRRAYPMFAEEPVHCAVSLYSVLESLWKARTELAKLKKGGRPGELLNSRRARLPAVNTKSIVHRRRKRDI